VAGVIQLTLAAGRRVAAEMAPAVEAEEHADPDTAFGTVRLKAVEVVLVAGLDGIVERGQQVLQDRGEPQHPLAPGRAGRRSRGDLGLVVTEHRGRGDDAGVQPHHGAGRLRVGNDGVHGGLTS
jgi:hypothetical protein